MLRHAVVHVRAMAQLSKYRDTLDKAMKSSARLAMPPMQGHTMIVIDCQKHLLASKTLANAMLAASLIESGCERTSIVRGRFGVRASLM